MDSLVYRTSAPTEFTNGADANMDGDERVVDPFEGTVGLIVSCPNCHMQVDVRGSRVGRESEGVVVEGDGLLRGTGHMLDQHHIRLRQG